MKYQQPFGSSDPDASYVDRNTVGATKGSPVPAKAIEQAQRELVALIQFCGLTPSDADLTQVSEAIQTGKLNYALATGAANALTATLSPAPTLQAGLYVNLLVTAPNTGPATLNLNSHGPANIVNLFGGPLVGGELIGPVRFQYDGTKWWASVIQPVLTQNLNLYVNGSTGNDSNNGLTTGTAFATIQKAVSKVQSLNLNGFTATINVADGSYAGPVALGTLTGGTATIVGNPGAPQNCSVVSAAGSGFILSAGRWNINGFRINAQSASGTDPGAGVYSGASGANASVQNLYFVGCAGGHLYASNGGGITIVGRVSFAGNAPASLLASVGGTITLNPAAGPILAVPAAYTVSTAFSAANDLGSIWGHWSSIDAGGQTVTGQKYVAANNGVIDTLGSGINYYPGNTAGTTLNGGIYA